ncbi:MAG: hypothetical protein WDN46_11395 [Methylocella sp.]
MRRVLAAAAIAVSIGGGVVFGQVAPRPGMGPTSPLGSINSNAPSGPTGIPLGASELNTVGESPLAGATPCNSGAATAGESAGLSSTFDGGGSATMGTGCGSGGSGLPLGGAGTSGVAGSAPGSMGSGIPLGATELGVPGESPETTGSPPPDVPGTPCPGLSVTSGAPGMSAASRC